MEICDTERVIPESNLVVNIFWYGKTDDIKILCFYTVFNSIPVKNICSCFTFSNELFVRINIYATT